MCAVAVEVHRVIVGVFGEPLLLVCVPCDILSIRRGTFHERRLTSCADKIVSANNLASGAKTTTELFKSDVEDQK